MRGAGAWTGRNEISEQQIGAAVGVNDPAMFAYVWKNNPDNVEAVERDRAVFRDHRMGIYASQGFRLMAGDFALPTTEVHCDYAITTVRQHAPDPHAFLVRGTTKSEDGSTMSRVLFQDEAGKGLGWALAQLPSDKLLEQLLSKASWGGHFRLAGNAGANQAVNAVAFDATRRCQPYPLTLPLP